MISEQHPNISYIDMQCRELRDLKGRGAWAVATKGLRSFKSRSSLCCTSGFACCKFNY